MSTRQERAAAGSLQDQVAVITGAASGIGLEIAATFARAGAKVAITDIDTTAAQTAASAIGAAGAQTLAVAMDVTREAQVERAMARVLKRFGRIDVLVCNAGIQIVSPIEKLAFADWRRLLAVHLDGAFLATRAVLPAMYRQRRGSIIYMGSVHSKEASLLKAPYVTAKHGLIGLAKAVAREGAEHGVRANTICPGFVRTPLVERQIPEQARALGLTEQQVVRQVMLSQTADGEFTTVQDVAQAALFFASFESNALTGQSLVVSHGWHMQ
ncbi:MAG TPA: 3-hydroxybutyrate dehydrogenase [Steroidobacteraceae bacterium]|nr:3-hydroxybutyrate dehydrogenase [Steroidobacteraceae bacterium]